MKRFLLFVVCIFVLIPFQLGGLGLYLSKLILGSSSEPELLFFDEKRCCVQTARTYRHS